MPEFKIFEGDYDSGWTSLMAYKLYPHDEDKRAGYYASNISARLSDLIKLEKISINPEDRQTFLTHNDIDETNIRDMVKAVGNSSKILQEFRADKDRECLFPINGQEALINSPSMEQFQKEIDKGFFKWIALGTMIRLISDFNCFYEHGYCKKRPSKSRIFKLIKKNKELKHLMLCFSEKNFDKEWRDNYASLHLYAAFAKIAVPNYTVLYNLEKDGCLVLNGVTDIQKQLPVLRQWREEIAQKLQTMGIFNFLRLSLAYQNFACNYKSPSRTDTLLLKERVHTIHGNSFYKKELINIPYNVLRLTHPSIVTPAVLKIYTPPQELIESYNRIP